MTKAKKDATIYTLVISKNGEKFNLQFLDWEIMYEAKYKFRQLGFTIEACDEFGTVCYRDATRAVAAVTDFTK